MLVPALSTTKGKKERRDMAKREAKSRTFTLTDEEYAMIGAVTRGMASAEDFPDSGKEKMTRTKALTALFYDKYISINGEAPPGVYRPKGRAAPDQQASENIAEAFTGSADSLIGGG